MNLKRLDHIGVIVADLEAASAMLEGTLGLERTHGITRPDLRAAFFRCGDASVELIEIIDPDQHRTRLGEGQKARIEHIAFEVDDLQGTITALEALGISSTAPPRSSGNTLTFWTRPETTEGIMLQLLQRMEQGN